LFCPFLIPTTRFITLAQQHRSQTRTRTRTKTTRSHLLMDPTQPRPVAQRKRSYSTTAYSSLEDHHQSTATSTFLSGTNGSSHSTTGQQAAQPICLLATAAGTQVLTYEFIDNGTVAPFSSSTIANKQQQVPIVPGQFDGIQMSNERTAFTMASLRWSPDSKSFHRVATTGLWTGTRSTQYKQLEDTHYSSRLLFVLFPDNHRQHAGSGGT
jgi:hypothetical protein